MTPEAAYAYVKSIRPRVLLAATQWKVIDRGTHILCSVLLHPLDSFLCLQAVLEYYHTMVLSTKSSLADATSALIPRKVKQVYSGNVVVFDDGSMVVVTRSDLEGYDDDDDSQRSMNVAGNELWAAAADLSMVYRVKVVGQAALARISCLWLGLREDHKLSGKNLSMGGISVDISVY